MSEELETRKKIIRDILSQGTDVTENKYSYINNVQLYFGANEVILDLYFLAPGNKPNEPTAQAQRIHRIVLPLAVAKEMGQLILNGIANWEESVGITLPIEPSADLGTEGQEGHE